MHHEPDGRFPNGVPNPLLPENRAATAEAVTRPRRRPRHCLGRRLRPLLPLRRARQFHRGLLHRRPARRRPSWPRHPGAKIIHDPRLTWNTIDMVRAAGGVPVQSKTGHAFIKERMRAEDAIYGGEMSAHHYFRDFAYCDSGMIPWLLVLELMSRSGQTLSRAGRRADGALSRQRRDQPPPGRPRPPRWPASRPITAPTPCTSTTPTASPWSSPTGASTCAGPTPSR